MSERVAQKVEIPGAVLVAAIAIVLYSLWGASVMSAERDAAASGSPSEQLATAQI